MDIRLVFVTCPADEQAETIAHSLVEQKLAACVNIVSGMTSIYRWQGEIEHAAEKLLIIKTAASKLDGIEHALRQLHPYDTFEFVALAPEQVGERYGRWVIESIGQQ